MTTRQTPEDIQAMEEFLAKIPRKIDAPPSCRIYGKTTKMGLSQFVYLLFKTNELRYVNQLKTGEKPLTDAMIADALIKEFGGKKGVKNFASRFESAKTGVSHYRGLYNFGRLSGFTPPEYFSFRYDGDGQRVDRNTGRYLLSVEEQKQLLLKHQTWWDRWREKQKLKGKRKPKYRQKQRAGLKKRDT